MQTIIGVRFKKVGKIYFFSPAGVEVKVHDRVVVETSRGTECGTVVLGPRELEEKGKELLPVLRLATEEDLRRIEENKTRAAKAFHVCEERIAAHGLAMKLIRVECSFDGRKLLCCFTSDGRVDFRELVKDLAAIFHMRIELRQIGVRDEAKLVGGIGCCGRPLCCATFLGDFEPVSIRMAKEQNLSLNPTKISGICGRLMCCLKYESNCYEGGSCPCHRKKARAKKPTQGSRVVTADGEGKVMALNEQRRTATILFDDHRTVVTSWNDIVEKSVDTESIEDLEADEAREEEHTMETAVERSKGSYRGRSKRNDRDEIRDGRRSHSRRPQDIHSARTGGRNVKNQRRQPPMRGARESRGQRKPPKS